jgi:hypothetical protein
MIIYSIKTTNYTPNERAAAKYNTVTSWQTRHYKSNGELRLQGLPLPQLPPSPCELHVDLASALELQKITKP